MKTSRKWLVWVAALAVTVGVSSVNAASLVSVGVLSENPDGSTGDGYTVPLSLVHSISSDGSQACGSSVWDNGARVPFRAWAPYGGPPNMVAMANKGGGYAGGIAVNDGEIHMSGNVGSWYYLQNIGRYSTNGTSFGTLNPSSENLVGDFNSVSADGTILTGQRMKSFHLQGLYWKFSNIGANGTQIKSLSGKMVINSPSNVNTAVGQDRHGNGGSKDGAVYIASLTGKVRQGIPPLYGEITDRGQGRGISANGQYLSGYLYSTWTGPGTYKGFRWSPGDALSTPLQPYGSDTLSWGGDVADDGTCAGWSYGPEGHDSGYDAAFWPGGTLQCVLVQDYLESIGVDTSEWSSLAKVYSISDDGHIVGGYGYWAADGTLRGYIADLREPLIGDLDILPGDSSNLFTVNKQGKGRLPMELYSTEDIAVADIDLESINIAGVEPVQAKIDGDTLLLKFSRRDLIDALGLDALEAGTVVDVTVKAARAADGWPVEATDSIELEARAD